MKLRGKILSGYLLLTLVFTLGILICYQTLSPIKSSMERLSEENLPVLNLIHDIRTQGLLLHAEQLKIAYLLSRPTSMTTEKSLSFELTELNRTREQLLKDLSDYQRLVELNFPEEIEFIPRLQTQIDRLIDLSTQLEKQILAPAATLTVLQSFQFEAIEESFLQITGEIVGYETHEVNQRRERINAKVKSARLQIGLTGLTLVGSSILFALLFSRWLAALVEKQPTGQEGELARKSTPVEK